MHEHGVAGDGGVAAQCDAHVCGYADGGRIGRPCHFRSWRYHAAEIFDADVSSLAQHRRYRNCGATKGRGRHQGLLPLAQAGAHGLFAAFGVGACRLASVCQRASIAGGCTERLHRRQRNVFSHCDDRPVFRLPRYDHQRRAEGIWQHQGAHDIKRCCQHHQSCAQLSSHQRHLVFPTAGAYRFRGFHGVFHVRDFPSCALLGGIAAFARRAFHCRRGIRHLAL